MPEAGECAPLWNVSCKCLILRLIDTLFSLTDIRDTVNYKEIMKQYGLGPNGGIVTSLNLFATRFDQVMGFIEKRAPECK